MYLFGRQAEREAIDTLLDAAEGGRSGTLVVRGEAGIGKTALLVHAREYAKTPGFRVESCVGMEAETQFAYAGLHQLCAPLIDRASALPEPQHAALGVAFGLRRGEIPNRFLVGLAILNLLAEVAEDSPLLCLVDDAQWLDQASSQVLAFVARRIEAERMALVFAMRHDDARDTDSFAGLPELMLKGLDESDALTLLTEGIRAPLDDDVRDRMVAEARGNPLALLELPRSVDANRLAGGFALPDALSVPRRIEDSFQRRSAGLSGDAQSLLLVAAAEPTGDAALLWRAAEDLGVVRAAAAPAEASRLLEIDTQVRFRHPLVRSAVYRAATPAERRRAHRALAAATDPLVDPDRRAWHRAQAVLGTDEDAAADLERTADRTRARGGVAAAAAFLQQAAELTADPAERARRALEAAHAKHDAGASSTATELLATAEVGPLDEFQRARAQLLRARIAFHLTEDPEVPGMLLDAARTLAPVDPALSRETYLHALDAAMIIGVDDRGVLELADAALAAPASPNSPRPADLLLDGLVTTFTQGYAAGVVEVRRALQTFRDHGFDGEALGEMGSRRWLSLASRSAAALFDDELVGVLAARSVALARDAGALATLPQALVASSALLVLSGDVAHAAELAAESSAITLATGAVPLRSALLFLAAWRGREAETAQLYTASIEDPNGNGAEATLAHYALAVLHNGLGNYPMALDAAGRACASQELMNGSLALPELIEAAIRTDHREKAEVALERLLSRTNASGTQWALGVAAYARALTTAGPAAEGHYRHAIDRLRGCRMVSYLARAHLVYGEWLRREGRRLDAREQLHVAHELLSNMGAEAFAERAARELRATGERPRKRTIEPADALTDHELQIARLVSTGATSREVAQQLFLSPRTIEAHLRNIFKKLRITSRRQLKELRLDTVRPPPP